MIIFWKFCAGLGFFLYAMYLLEDSLRLLTGRAAKLFLKKHTENRLAAATSGALVTFALQSSSVVILMTLALVGAGAFGLQNAMALIIGSNFGTTLYNWVVATLGFKFNIEDFSLPLIAISTIALPFTNPLTSPYQVLRFLLGFGFVFLGLGFMKDSIGYWLMDFDFAPYAGYPLIAFVVIGFIITALIQSSSATMVIVLSALDTGTIPFEMATAVVVGSELGTALKIVTGAAGGIATKKRLAMGNLFFNVMVTFIGYLCIYPLIALVQGIAGPKEPLIALVLFQSTINLLGLILLLPFLPAFIRLLEKMYKGNHHTATYYLASASPQMPDLALDALEKETRFFLQRVWLLNLEAFHISDLPIKNPDEFKSIANNHRSRQTYLERYEEIKHAEGEILSFYLKLQEENQRETEVKQTNRLINAVRNAMYSAKSMKDILHNRNDFRGSADNSKYELYKFSQEQIRRFYIEADAVSDVKDQETCLKKLELLMEKAREDYDSRTSRIYKMVTERAVQETDIATMLNLNRELFSAAKSVVNALKDYLLDEAHIEIFENARND